jgi:hypothetical protein
MGPRRAAYPCWAVTGSVPTWLARSWNLPSRRWTVILVRRASSVVISARGLEGLDRRAGPPTDRDRGRTSTVPRALSTLGATAQSVECIANRNRPLLMKVVVNCGRNPFPVMHRHGSSSLSNCTVLDVSFHLQGRKGQGGARNKTDPHDRHNLFETRWFEPIVRLCVRRLAPRSVAHHLRSAAPT